MPEAHRSMDAIFSEAEERLEKIVEQFEAAWQTGHRPKIEDYLPLDAARRPTLIELIHVDLERRLKNGENARVEQYLGHYPELAPDDEAVLDLLAAEIELRRRWEPALTPQDYEQRFPR